MTVSLNTSDPLYGNIRALFCVDNNVIKELKNNTALTVASQVRLPNSGTPSTTAPFGPSFGTQPNGAYDFYGVTFPAIVFDTTQPCSVMFVLNKWTSSDGIPALLGGTFNATRIAMLGIDGKPFAFESTVKAASIASGGHSVLITRSGNDNALLYVDGAIDPAYSGGVFSGYTNNNRPFDSIGGIAGQGNVVADVVFVVVFNNTVSASDAARLHASLSGDGAFALTTVSGGGGDTTAPVMTGSIGYGTPTSTSYTLTWSAATDNVAVTGYEYSLDGGTSYIDAGNVLTKAITGRTPGSTDQVRVRAYDAASNKASPLSASVTLAAGGGDTTAPTLTGTITYSTPTSTGYTLTWPAGSDNVAVTGYEYSLDGGSTYTSAGNVLTKAITGRTPGTTDQVRVRAFDAAGNRSSPLSVAVTLAGGGGGGAGSYTTPALGNNTNTGALSSVAVYWSYFPGWRVGDAISTAPTHGSGTLSASGILTIASGLPSGTSGRLEIDVRNNSDPAQDSSYVMWITVP